MSEKFNCPICGSNTVSYIEGTVGAADFFAEGSPYVIASGSDGTRLPVRRCASCGHGYAPMEGVGADEVVKWYERYEDETFLADESARRKTADVVLKRIKKVVSSGKLLDVGAGPGVFASEAKRQGWQALGLEPSQWAVEQGIREFDVPMKQAGFTSLKEMPGASYDVVTIFDVIEHVIDPEELLSSIYKVLRPGGLLVVTTPRFDSLFARVLGKHWHAIFPAHQHAADTSQTTAR